MMADLSEANMPDLVGGVRETLRAVEKWTGTQLPRGSLCVLPGLVKRVWNGFLICETRWRGIDKSTRVVVMRRDFERCIRRNVPVGIGGPPAEQNVYDWGIEGSRSWFDFMEEKLPYLANSGYRGYEHDVEEIMSEMIVSGGWNIVRDVMEEMAQGRELRGVAQFGTSRLIEHSDFLNRHLCTARTEVENYLMIYRELCEYYAKDMKVPYCLLQWTKTKKRFKYKELKEGPRATNSRIEWVVSVRPSLVSGYDGQVRNALAHEDRYVDDDQRVVLLQSREGEIRLTYDQLVTKTRELSAFVWVMRFAFALWARVCWRQLQAMLEEGGAGWVWPVSVESHPDRGSVLYRRT